MSMNRFVVLFSVFVCMAAGCSAERDSSLRVQAWARATPPGSAVGGAYLTIRNPGSADRLLKVLTAASERTEIHRTSMADGQMQMREVGALDIPANSEVKLESGGMHLMLVGLKKPLREGESVPLTLQFAQAGTLQVQARVQSIGATSADEASRWIWNATRPP